MSNIFANMWKSQYFRWNLAWCYTKIKQSHEKNYTFSTLDYNSFVIDCSITRYNIPNQHNLIQHKINLSIYLQCKWQTKEEKNVNTTTDEFLLFIILKQMCFVYVYMHWHWYNIRMCIAYAYVCNRTALLILKMMWSKSMKFFAFLLCDENYLTLRLIYSMYCFTVASHLHLKQHTLRIRFFSFLYWMNSNDSENDNNTNGDNSY